MQHKVDPIMKKRMLTNLLITILFNTLIAMIMNYLVLEKPAFGNVFIISQIMGLSIFSCMGTAKYLAQDKKIMLVIAGYVLGMVAGVLSGSLLSWLFLYMFYGQDFRVFTKSVLSYTLIFGIVFGVPITYYFSSRMKIQASERKIQEEKIRRLTLEKESAMTTLKLMQAQIEPHFLFNTLSNAVSLLDIDIEKAKKMLIDFNDYLRITLQRTRQEMVTLEQEFELITHYLDIFKIRMGQRLTYAINADARLRKIAFPPMIIQPLVENAVKHGIAPKAEGGRLTIDCFSENGCLKIVIADDGVGFGKSNGRSGIGLNNVSTRLEYIYGHQARFVINENRPSGVKATIEVPL